jgi:hypothetical protein
VVANYPVEKLEKNQYIAIAIFTNNYVNDKMKLYYNATYRKYVQEYNQIKQDGKIPAIRQLKNMILREGIK